MLSDSSAANGPYRLFLFGTPRLVCDGQALAFTRRKAPLLLGYLAMHPGQHPRDSLAALLWPDRDPDAARLSLRVTVAELRKRLGDAAVTGDRQTLQLKADFALWVDALEIQRCAASAQPQDWQAALQWHDGEFAPGAAPAWADAWRARLGRWQVEILLKLCAHERTQADYPQAIALARRALVLEPANEIAHQQAMICLEALGDRTAALQQFDICQQALHGALGARPSAATLAIARRLQSPAPVHFAQEEGPAHNLPVPLTSFVGRAAQLQELFAMLLPAAGAAPAARLVTLTGAGGTGKTRLSIQLGRMLQAAYPQGVWWIELAALAPDGAATLVAREMASVCGVKEVPTEPVAATLLAALRHRRCLLVLDNCEHLVAACAEVARQVLAHCPFVTLLASSRNGLAIAGEQTFPVPTLGLPDMEETSLQTIVNSDGVRLFVERARAVLPGFVLDGSNITAVLTICHRLDGIPLAIELATARLKLLTPAQIAARLDDRFRLLVSSDRAALPRQRTLLALIDWSHDLLPEAERAVLRTVSVFRGGWTVEAARAVCGDIGSETGNDMAALLALLADKSLLVRASSTGDGQRYTTLETIREYAALKLAASGEAVVIGARHFHYFLQFAQALAPLLEGPAQLQSINALKREHDNLRAAQAWALAQSAVELRLRLGAALGKFWRLHHHVQEGADYLLTALIGSKAQDSMLRAHCCYWTGELLWRKGDEAPALALLDEAQALYQALGNDIGLADVAYRVGAVAAARGDLETADRQFAQAAVLARKSANSFMLLNCINAMGENARMRCDYLQAKACYEELLQRAQQAEDNRMVAFALLNQGLTSVPLGDSAAARRQLAQAYVIFCELGEKPMLPYVLEGLAGAAAGEGHSARAVSLYAATERLCAEIQFSLYQPDQQQHELAVQRLRQQLTATQFDSAWQAGLGLTLQQAVQLAQATPPP